MSIKQNVAAALLGVSVVIGATAPVQAELLRIMNGQASSTLNVAMNRAVVVESDTPFAELSIANPGIADISTLSDRSIYVLGKAPGRTTLTILDADGRLISNVEVQVTPDVTEFRERLRQILPNEQIEVRTANDGIVLSGLVSSPAKMDAALQLANRYAPERVSNLMSVGGTQQVMLKVRFSEMQREIGKNLGISLNASAPRVSALSGDRQFQPQGQLAARFGGGSFSAQVLLEALETQGMARTLAEPNLTALSGQQANFLAGGEFPVPAVDGDGRVSISYRPFGVELEFTPRVLDNRMINLELAASVSSIDETAALTQQGISTPAFRRRETSTTVELRDGESFAIAGLLEDDFRALSRQVPWLGDIPVLGALFRSSEYSRNQTELVIIITAHLVTPTTSQALMLPTDRVRPPTESELFLGGRVSAPALTGAAREVSQQDFVSPYGYVMD